MNTHKSLIITTLTIVFIALLSGCGDGNKSTEPEKPDFEPKFPPKTIVVKNNWRNGSTGITFSSIEEAEWELLHLKVTSISSFNDVFEQVLLSDPSSMDYPFDSLSAKYDGVRFTPVASDDGNVRFFGVEGGAVIPHMIAPYRINGEVKLADEYGEKCYFCLNPDTIFTFNTGKSTIYLVLGFAGSEPGMSQYDLHAFELDSTGLHPFSAFESYLEDEADEQIITVGMITTDDWDFINENGGVKKLITFDKQTGTIYKPYFSKKANSMIEEVLYVWDGKKFKIKK